MSSTLSTIYVDDREIERDHPTRENEKSGVNMLSLVRSHRDHPTALPKHLPSGDFCFAGEGPKGPCLVGIERKRIKDMLSSIRTGRMAEQLVAMLNHYDYSFLILEGTFRTNWYSGVLEDKYGRDYSPVTVGKSTFLGLELESALSSIVTCTPVRYIRTRSDRETVDWLISLNHAFSKPWDQQLAKITAIHQPEQYATVGKASTIRRVGHALSGLGWERSGTLEQNYNSVWDVMSTDPNCVCIRPAKDYEKLPGFGKVLSKRVWDQLHGNYDPGVLE
jgi:ERCC4-type nuclease